MEEQLRMPLNGWVADVLDNFFIDHLGNIVCNRCKIAYTTGEDAKRTRPLFQAKIEERRAQEAAGANARGGALQIEESSRPLSCVFCKRDMLALYRPDLDSKTFARPESDSSRDRLEGEFNYTCKKCGLFWKAVPWCRDLGMIILNKSRCGNCA
jgi:hypothetical protein